MSKDELLRLAERCEAATAGQQREMLEEAFTAIHGPMPPRIHGGSAEMTAWLVLRNPLYNLLIAKGFIDAAMQLVPEGCVPFFDWHHKATDARGIVSYEAYVQTIAEAKTLGSGEAISYALALCAAALRARIAQAQSEDRTNEQG